MQSKEFTMDEYLLHIQQKQREEIERNKQNAENVRKLIDGYTREVKGKPRPNLKRLKLMKRDVQKFLSTYQGKLLDLNSTQDSPTSYHSYELPASFGQMSYAHYCDWRRRVIDEMISRCTLLMNVIDTDLTYPMPPTATDQNPLTKDEPLTNKRGPYRNDARTSAVNIYKSKVESAINAALHNNQKPDQVKIEALVIKYLIEDKAYNDRTLRKYLPVATKTEIYGQLYRHVSENRTLIDRTLR